MCNRGSSTYDIQLRAAIVHRHIPPLADILAIGEELIHEIGEREATFLKDAGLAVLRKDHVGRVESRGGSNSNAFFASGDLVAVVRGVCLKKGGSTKERDRASVPYRTRDGPAAEHRT